MSKIPISEYVRGHAVFLHYTDGNLWYKCENGFTFPIPIEDTKGGVFSRIEKGILLMRWIRKHLETLPS